MRAVLDACVLYPTVLRGVLLGVAEAGLLAPVWSGRIMEEWVRATAKLGPGAQAQARGEAALLDAAWPDARVIPAPSSLSLPDPADVHVAEAALAGGAALIVTLNLRDFPARALGAFGLRAEHPDTVLLGLWREAPEAVEAAVAAVRREAERHAGGDLPLRPFLKRAGLPRLARALGQGPGPC